MSLGYIEKIRNINGFHFNWVVFENQCTKCLLVLAAWLRLNLVVYLVLFFLIIGMTKGNAAGFAVLEQSVRGLGNAYAGGTAGGQDISALFNNPAGLSEYQGTNILTGAHIVLPEARFEVERSSDSLNRSLSGGDGSNAGENVLIPNIYLSTDVTESFRLGLGITVPFGLGTRYNQDWQGRYEAIDSELKTIDVNPSISYAVNDMVSLGFGLSAQYIDVDLSNAIDFGSLCFSQLDAASCSGLGLAPQNADGSIELNADGWGWGYNVGVLFKPIPALRLGIAYRSRVNHQIKGDAKFKVPGAARPLTASGAFKNTDVEAAVDMPSNLAFGAIYQVNEQWTMLFDLTWTHWNQLDRLTTQFNNPSQPSSTLDLDFKNTIRASIGATYHLNQDWSILTGFAYDESPVRNSQARTFRVPDNDRYWLAIGLGFKPTSNLKFNLAYAHVFIKDGLVDRLDRTGNAISGSFKSEINIISAELQWTF
ncbi:MAG: DUF1302 family protein [Methylococcaceae bacterium]